jgi:hypothetical protein
MAKPRVFISSTFYDLRHIRTDIERFVTELGYEPVRNETGDIPYGMKENLEEYCYKEVKEVDILVGIIGNRFGSNSKDNQHSITQLEITTAYKEGKQVYLFVDRSVFSEYQTYLLNKGTQTKYSFVDNIKIFEFIEEIYAIKAGIIISSFENVSEITTYLKLQWAGLFRDLLRQSSESQKLLKLESKIDDLEIITETLKSYIEKSLPSLLEDKDVAESYIKNENLKIDIKKLDNRLLEISFIEQMVDTFGVDFSTLKDYIVECNTIEEFEDKIGDELKVVKIHFSPADIRDIQKARSILGLKPIYALPSDFKN